MTERSDDDMVLKLVERSRLLIALSDEIPTETKLQTQPLLKQLDRKSTRLNSSHIQKSRMPSSA